MPPYEDAGEGNTLQQEAKPTYQSLADEFKPLHANQVPSIISLSGRCRTIAFRSGE